MAFGRASGAACSSAEFPGEEEEEGAVAGEVAPQEAAGFLEQSPEPFESGLLHPEGGAGDIAGPDVHGAADADADAAAGGGEVFGEEEFLAGGAESGDEEIGAGGGDGGADGEGVGEVAVEGAGEGEGGEVFPEFGGAEGEGRVGAAEEEDAVSVGGAVGEECPG
jgi:hypothetical protein